MNCLTMLEVLKLNSANKKSVTIIKLLDRLVSVWFIQFISSFSIKYTKEGIALKHDTEETFADYRESRVAEIVSKAIGNVV